METHGGRVEDIKYNPNLRDRTYRTGFDGEYLDNRQYMVVAVTLGMTHFLMEFFYIWVGCTPMIYINIASMLTYAVCALLIKKGHHLMTVWIIEVEIYWHVIFACMFMGFKCGYQLWFFGAFSSIFLPFFIPNLSKRPKMAIGLFSLVIFLGFELLVYFERHDMLPTQYRVGDDLATVLYYVNAAFGFASIMIYTAIYNQRMMSTNRKLQYVADHDGLTEIFNRKKIQEILSAEIKRQENNAEGNLFIAILDIDFFKNINDTYGHTSGDRVLKGVTNCFRDYWKYGLMCGRWGGEEMLLISPEIISYEEYGNLLEMLRKDIESREFSSGDQTIKVTVSIGAAAYEKGMSVDKFVQEADARLYEAKESGRNRVVW